jgi:hypothetical protein
METTRPKGFPGQDRRQPPGSGKPNRAWAVKLADLVDPCLAPVIAKQGFGAADIILHWREIVGERFSRVCEPVRLQWAGRKRGQAEATPSATLVVRVEGAFALELQHLAPILIERANARLGWRCVEKLALRQGPMLRPVVPPRARPAPAAAALAHAADVVGEVESDALREALVRLGAHVLGDKRA